MVQTKLKKDSDSEYYFYYKNQNREIVPNKDLLVNKEAKKILDKIYKEHKNDLPKRFSDNWRCVKLYHQGNNVTQAHSIILDLDNGAYDINNSLNHLTGKEWTKFSCSWFIFNALAKDLKEEREISGDSEDHPATFSPTMIEGFVNFFTKERMKVLDPFAGIGSSLVACKRTNRIGYGIELNEKYYQTILKRVPEFKKNVVNGDSRKIKEFFKDVKFNFCISSPPYWDILNRSTDGFKDTREKKGLDVRYSDKNHDLGNIDNYEKFINELAQIYFDIYDLLENESYIVVVIKNVKKKGVMYPLAWDLAKKLSEKYTLKDEKLWIQDKIGLSPYGYPHGWSSNILHHYCLILKKEDN